ncbi:MAG: metallophosphoesterase [Candidatus Omnitrophica bacterium]|nr:metallophosphoesterase [Candidatus Omnitrophota bacterium]
MKIGVLSDTHIPERAPALPRKIIEAFKGADMIIHAGDFVDTAVIAELRAVCGDVRAVAGNMDGSGVRKLFPEKQIIRAGRFSIGVKHGFGPPDKLIDQMLEAFKSNKVDAIVYGHSHQPCNRYINGILFFNPGSPTDEVFAPYKSFGIIEINDTIEAKIVKL